jgi:hypothetical protein
MLYRCENQSCNAQFKFASKIPLELLVIMPLKEKQKAELRSRRRPITQRSKAKKTCHGYFIAKKIGRNDLCRNCTSYADLVIKPKPQREMGQQRFGCQGL